jgi:hypothetical protein
MVYNGRYLELQEVEEGLKLTLTPDGREEIADLPETVLEDEILFTLLEDHLGNGWDLILPEDLGALTSGNILGRDIERDDENKIVHIGQVYWDSEYQVQSSVGQLKAGKSVTWQRAGDWAAKNEKAEGESPTHESGGLMAIAEYLGDSVYVTRNIQDPTMVMICTMNEPNKPENIIYLELEVQLALVNYIRRTDPTGIMGEKTES